MAAATGTESSHSEHREEVQPTLDLPPGPDQPPYDEPRGLADSWYVLASIVVSVLLYVAAAFIFHSLYVPPPVDASEFLPEYQSDVAPEPAERYLYLLGLACIPTLPTAVYGLLRWLGRRPTGITALLERPRLLLARDTALVLGIVGWLYFLAWQSEFSRLPTLLTYSLVLLGLIVLSLRLRLTVPRLVVGTVIAALLLFSTWMMTINVDWLVSTWYSTHHFDVPLGAVNQVWRGRTILVDSTSQYGIIYPYIAAWSLAPFGLSVRTLSAFFAVVCLLCWVLAYAAVGRKTGYGSIATLAFTASFLGVTHGIAGLEIPVDPRIGLFIISFTRTHQSRGMFFVWFVPIYLRSPRIWLLAVGYFAAGFWLLWNADMGVVVLVRPRFGVPGGFCQVSLWR